MRQLVYALMLAAVFSHCASARDEISPDNVRHVPELHILLGIQGYMLEKRFDGWIFSGRGQFDDLAREFLGLEGATRHRWFIVIPGMNTFRKPLLVYHPDDEPVFDGIDFYPLPYRSRKELEEYFSGYIKGFVFKVALNHSPDFNIPDLDRADAGLVQWLEGLGYEVISAGSMLSFFNTRWLLTHIETHAAAAAATDSALRLSTAWLAGEAGRGRGTTDYDLAREVEKNLKKLDLELVSPVIVRLDSLTLSDDFTVDRRNRRRIEPGSLLYLEVSARKRKTEDAMFARIGWTLCLDSTVEQSLAADWDRVASAADAALELLRARIPARRMTLGYQVDEAAREKLGPDPNILPRPLGRNLNAWGRDFGVQFDNYLARDDRELMPGMGFTLEPGIHRARHALRMCNNVVIDGEWRIILSAPLQRRIIPVLAGPAAIAELFDRTK